MSPPFFKEHLPTRSHEPFMTPKGRATVYLLLLKVLQKQKCPRL